MDHKECNGFTEDKGKKVPKVPLQTYHWEDVRRSRRKGGYPWTYLYKPPFSEEIDPEEYTMEAMRRSRSSSAMGKHDGVEILEISGSARSSTNALESPENEIVTEPSEETLNQPKRAFLSPDDTVQIEECQITEQPEPEVESAASSDNISQYLDKEDPLPPKSDIATTLNGNSDTSDERSKRAKSEETQPRKRKLSAESSYSRISLSKLGMMKKLRDVKSKIKPSKLTFSASKFKIPTTKKGSKASSEAPDSKKEPNKKSTTSTTKQPEKPVYIHIPLKPPEAETAEMPVLEKITEPPTTQEEKTEITPSPFQKAPELRTSRKGPLKINPAFKQLLKDVKQLGETEKKDLEPSIDPVVTPMDVTEPPESMEIQESKDSKTATVTSMETDSNDNDEMIIDTDEAQDISELKFQKPSTTSQKFAAEPPKNDKSEDTAESKADEDVFEHLFQASTSKEQTLQVSDPKDEQRKARSKSEEPERKRKLSIDSSYSRKSTSKLSIMKKLKEASDKIKGAFSLTSLKKEKEPVTKKDEKQRKTSKAVDILKPIPKVDPRTIKPVYIHIPLKPPPGETDEFSYLEFEEKREKPPTVPSSIAKESPTPESSPGSPPRGPTDVQFIFLTPPSDDETLNEKTPDIPETPSTELSSVFFGNKMEELKELAQSVVDKVSPETRRKNLLEPVSEESSSEKSLDHEDGKKDDTGINELNTKTDTEKPEPEANKDIAETTDKTKSPAKEQVIIVATKDKPEDSVKEQAVIVGTNDKVKDEQEKMLVDVEDGLSEARSKPDELKSSLKSESPPVIKKKVSFKRRSKTPKDSEKEDDYEEVSPPKDEVKVSETKNENEKSEVVVKKEEDTKEKDISLLQTSQSVSMSADEEKMYLDQKIVKDTSLEEDYSKWSKASDHDHEYEPINPPDEETFIESPQVTPSFQVTSPDDKVPSRISPLTTETVVIQTPPKEEVKPKESLRARIFHFHHSDNEEDEPESKTATASSDSKKPSADGPNKFQLAFKQKTDQIKNKFHNMKRPNITMPQRPKFNKPDFTKFKIEKPKFNLPKMPDKAKITFTMPKRGNTSATSKRSLKERNLSTESNDGDAKKSIFAFSTYPRPFKKKPKPPVSGESEISSYATTPRQKKTTESSDASSIRVPLHSEDSMEVDYNGDNSRNNEEFEREDSVERRMLESSRIRYKDIGDIDDDYARENQEINKAERWQHGSFNPHQNEEPTFEERFRQQQEDFDEHFRNSQYKVTDLDSPEDENRNFTNAPPMNKSAYSSEGSVGAPSPRPGVLEEIDSDQFIVREKGLSQDNIEIGQWISSEIREAFRTPTNALNEIRGSNQSLPLEGASKRKPVRKPKRKKTPHVSQEKLPYDNDEESMEDLPAYEDTPAPARPKRRSKRTRKPKSDTPAVVPYQETIAIDDDNMNIARERLQYQRESLAGVLGDDEHEDIDFQMYENERMAGKEQPEIQVTDPYRNLEFVEDEMSHGRPTAPPRRHRSLRSLTVSENDSTSGFNTRYDREEENNAINRAAEEELRKYIIPSTATEEPPRRPARSRSHGSSLSRGTSLKESESLQSYTSENQENQMPCVEEPCVQDIRDCMGYAIVDKNKPREPPLPPPRTSLRRKKRSVIEPDLKFSTVPRISSAVLKDEGQPVRPLRNYSTLQQVKQKHSIMDPVVYENNKENIDIIQYIEIDDDLNRNLQSGDVIEKMKIRPLPAPPRPPRKSKSTRQSLQDITSQSNIITDNQDIEDQTAEKVATNMQEETVSTQTEPLPEGFVCEELIQEPSDTLIEPSTGQRKTNEDTVTVERRLITPTHYTYEETVTHGALVVEPLNGAKILPDSEISSRERIVPVSREESDEETSLIPEEFGKLKDSITTKPPISKPLQAEVIKTQKLQISDLDVDRLTVNQLLANKIIVSEIESGSIQTSEIQSRSDDLNINELRLPPEFVKEIVKSLAKQSQSEEAQKIEQKKTSIDEKIDSEFLESEEKNAPPTPPPRTSSQPVESPDQEPKTMSIPTAEPYLEPSATPALKEHPDRSITPPSIKERSVTPPTALNETIQVQNNSTTTPTAQSEPIESPQRPPRRNEQMLEPEIDDEPPPRPPQPEVDEGPPPPRPPEPEVGYIPSQPPASFYALRAAQFVENLEREEDIPAVPRRRRHKRPISRSHSTSEESSNERVAGRTRHFRRYSEPDIPELTGRLMRACGDSVNASIKRLIFHVSNNVLGNADGKQDIHVMIVILLVLIAGLILLGYGDEKTVVHLHHWEYFNPPKDM